MAKHGIGLAVAMATTAALAQAAVASPYHRSCGSAGEGSVLGNSSEVESGPYGISMSAANAAGIAKRLPSGEFGDRLTQRDVPCWIAGAIGSSAGNAWLHWTSTKGSVGVIGTGSFGSFPLGRFSCTGRQINQSVRLPPMTYYFDIQETCTQGRGADSITGTFRIGNSSQS